MAENKINKSNVWRSVLDVNNMAENITYFLFLSMIAILYIWNMHYAEKTRRQMDVVKEQVKALRWSYVSSKSDLMHKSKQSEVAKLVEPYGLKELTVPPKKIMVLKDGH